jgi:hypothetical protein
MMVLQALNFNIKSRGNIVAELPECLKAVKAVFWWVGDDESGPADVRMMWILSAYGVDDDGFRLDLNA